MSVEYVYFLQCLTLCLSFTTVQLLPQNVIEYVNAYPVVTLHTPVVASVPILGNFVHISDESHETEHNVDSNNGGEDDLKQLLLDQNYNPSRMSNYIHVSNQESGNNNQIQIFDPKSDFQNQNIKGGNKVHNPKSKFIVDWEGNVHNPNQKTKLQDKNKSTQRNKAVRKYNHEEMEHFIFEVEDKLDEGWEQDRPNKNTKPKNTNSDLHVLENQIAKLENEADSLQNTFSNEPDQYTAIRVASEIDKILLMIKTMEKPHLPERLRVRINLLVRSLSNLLSESMLIIKTKLIQPMETKINCLLTELGKMKNSLFSRFTSKTLLNKVESDLETLKNELLTSTHPKILEKLEPQSKIILEELENLKTGYLPNGLKRAIDKFRIFLSPIENIFKGVLNTVQGVVKSLCIF